MSRTIIRTSGCDEWLRHREEGIGSSEVATILGLNPYETPYQLWRRKVGLDTQPKEENFAMRAGHYLEDAVSLFYRDATGKEIIKSSAGDWLIVNNERPYMRVSPDRTYWIPGRPKSDSNKGILECKTTLKNIDKDDVPLHWFCQLQYQLGVAELEQGALAWLTAGRTFDYAEYEFDADFFAWMRGEVERFWMVNVKEMQEPDATTEDDVLTHFPQHVVGKRVTATETLEDDCAKLKDVKAQIAELDQRKKELETIIKVAIGDAEALATAGGDVLATWKAAKDSTKFDEKRFAAENVDLYNSYLHTVAGSRRFLLK